MRFMRIQERNATAIYKARAILLGLAPDEHVIATIPETYKIQSASFLSGVAAAEEAGMSKSHTIHFI